MTFFVIFWTYSLHIGNRLPYRESAGDALFFFLNHVLRKIRRTI
jgi:hypothetical protein